MAALTNFLFFFFALHVFFSKVSISTDTLTSTQSLGVNQTLSSEGQVFELGFFSSGDSRWYLGIWYRNIPEKTVVWVANRDAPLENSNSSVHGILGFGDRGNIILVDQAGKTIWSSNQTTARNPVLQLLDSGNLVLTDANQSDPENYLWQSFDYPTNNLLPGMKLVWNLDSGIERHITSWRSDGNPSTGDFSFKIDPRGLPQIFLWDNQQITYRCGPWNVGKFSGVPEKPSGKYPMKFIFYWNEHEVYYTFSIWNPSFYSRLFMNPNGELQRLTWIESRQVWTKVWYSPKDQCDYYKVCGPYGICDINSSPVCNCVRGFRPKNQQAWSLRDGSDGCVRNTNLDCGTDKFVRLQNVMLPDTTSVFANKSMTLSECADLCHKNCSCTAYANIGTENGGTGCVMWADDLLDMKQTAVIGQDLYVRLAASDVETAKKKDNKLVIGIAVGIGAIALPACVYLLWKLTAKPKEKIEIRSQRITRDQKQVKLEELPLYDLIKVATATKDFDSANMLGKGGFGAVYKGELEDGQEIAVKRLSSASGQGAEEFMNEVLVISKLQHRNLVKLLACCIEVDEKMLIYEFMPNKSLDAFLFDPIQRKSLDWKRRFHIIEGIARGLLYLHRDSRLKIIHRDLKASNILLDGEMNPKISDFGLAKIFESTEDGTNTRRVVGTYGYMSPEYAMKGLFSEKSDVYSFGVLLLEMVSGRRNIDFYNHEQSHSLLELAWKLWNEVNIISLIDPEISNSCFKSDILRCIHIGLLCVQENAKERPTMSTVVSMLASEIVNLPPPRQVAFVSRHNLSSSELSYRKNKYNTSNNVTISEIQGR